MQTTPKEYLNTSRVTVKQKSPHRGFLTYYHLNTSRVTVKRDYWYSSSLVSRI